MEVTLPANTDQPHEVCRAAGAERRTGNCADDVTILDEILLFQAALCGLCELIDIVPPFDAAREHPPEQAHLASSILIRRESNDGSTRAVLGYESRRTAGFREDGDSFHFQFFSRMADGFGYRFADEKIAGMCRAQRFGGIGFGFANDAVHH